MAEYDIAAALAEAHNFTDPEGAPWRSDDPYIRSLAARVVATTHFAEHNRQVAEKALPDREALASALATSRSARTSTGSKRTYYLEMADDVLTAIQASIHSSTEEPK